MEKFSFQGIRSVLKMLIFDTANFKSGLKP